ncbi:MAG: flagellar FlbD family protein [Candidatus Saccharibacteria bacterium]
MLNLTRLNGQKITLNLDLIETMEETPDTVITLTTGKKLVVKESIQQIVSDIVKFKRMISLKLKK